MNPNFNYNRAPFQTNYNVNFNNSFSQNAYNKIPTATRPTVPTSAPAIKSVSMMPFLDWISGNFRIRQLSSAIIFFSISFFLLFIRNIVASVTGLSPNNLVDVCYYSIILSAFFSSFVLFQTLQIHVRPLLGISRNLFYFGIWSVVLCLIGTLTSVSSAHSLSRSKLKIRCEEAEDFEQCQPMKKIYTYTFLCTIMLYVLETFYNRRYVLQWPHLQAPRLLSLKQSFLRSFRSLFIGYLQLFYFAIPLIFGLFYYNQFGFRVLFQLEFIMLELRFYWKFGQEVFNRIFTERIHFSAKVRPEDENHRHLALMKSDDRFVYHQYHAFQDLEFSVANLPKERNFIYKKQWADLKTILSYQINDMKKNTCDLIKVSQSLLRKRARHEIFEPYFRYISERETFGRYRTALWAMRSYSFLLFHSIKEDTRGVVQDSLPEILGELLDLLVALEEYQTLCQYTEPIVVKLIFSLEESIARILTAFHPYIDALQMVRPAHQKRLFAIIGQ